MGINVGDVVVLRSEPTMRLTVTELDHTGDGKLTCCWFDSRSYAFRIERLPPETLLLVEAAASIQDALLKMAQSGASLAPDDPVIKDVRKYAPRAARGRKRRKK